MFLRHAPWSWPWNRGKIAGIFANAIDAAKPALPNFAEMKQILLLIETASGWGRQLLNGIGQYVREHGSWNLYFEERSLYDLLPKSLDHWKGDGIMSRTAAKGAADRLRELGIPLVECWDSNRKVPPRSTATTWPAGGWPRSTS
jgi:hypothetical protein